MSDVAKKKIYSKYYPETTDYYSGGLVFNPEDGSVNVELTRELRPPSDRKIDYPEPKDKQQVHARNLVIIHWKLVAGKIKDCPSSFIAVMACLIEHAGNDGECFPGQGTIAKETGYSRQTVNKTLRWIEERPKLIKTQSRGITKTKAYLIQWDTLMQLYQMAQRRMQRHCKV